ncbi:MAG: hypothetical protein WCC48_07375, partial [Anaeromyxobacteraceae bacterium]
AHAGVQPGAAQSTAQRQAEQLGSLLTRLVRGAVTGKAASATSATTSGTSSSAAGSLAFLKDSRLSVEEKLARLMVQLSDKYEKQLEQKLQQYGDLESGKTSSSSSTKKSSSSEPSIVSALGKGLSSLASKAGLGKELAGFLPKLASQVAGPVLAGAATALGLPALAPLILKAGPLLGSVASGVVSGLTGSATASGKSTTSSKASTSGSSGSSSASAPSEKLLMTEIQILQEKQKEMFSLVSNILRSMHDTKMAVIGNVR